MDKFAFIGHPTDFKNLSLLLGKWGFLSKILSKVRLKQIINVLPPYKLFYIDSIRSITGKKITGYAIVCPLFPEQMIGLGKEKVLNKLIAAVRLAQRLGVRIVGLGGFTSIVTDGGKDLVSKVNIAITSGNTYTAYLAIDSLLKAADILELNLKKSTLAIIGATGDIGSICAKVLLNKVGRLLLAARDQERLKDFTCLLKKENASIDIVIVRRAEDVTLSADIILTATSAITTLIKPEQLKAGSIVCDVSIPPNIAREIVHKRTDVLVFEGGLASLPFTKEIKNSIWHKLFPYNAIFGCLAETMLLTLDAKFENFSLGRGSITLEKLSTINELALKHGFRHTPFFCGDKIYNNDDIEKLRNIIRGRICQ